MKEIHLKDFNRKTIGNILFWMFLMVLMIDPTNTILHKKDVLFCLLIIYNSIMFKPDISKLPYIIIFACSVFIPYIISCITMTQSDETEVLAIFKSASPILLLLWVKYYDLVKLSRGPVVICCVISSVVYIAMFIEPMVESAVWLFMKATDFPVMMSRRTILGVEIFTFYLKSFVSFLFVVSYYIFSLLDKSKRNILVFFYMIFIMVAFMASGTRSTMLVPFFLFVVIAFKVYKNTQYVKYIMMPMIFCLGILFVFVLVAAATEKAEPSNIVKYGHLTSYISLFNDNPLYLLFGQGPGTSFYTEGFNEVVYKTEWSYIELLRNFGVFAIGIIYVFFKPLLSFWRERNSSDVFTYCMFWAYLAYLMIAGTNPLIMSSTGMITLLMAYSYEEKIKEIDQNII